MKMFRATAACATERAAHSSGGPALRHSTKAVLTNEMTASPFWFTPVLRTVTTPQLGRLFDLRVSMTSVR
jgi:hypothetical protein